MAFITPQEIIDIVIMVAAITFIFKDAFRPPPQEHYDPLAAIKRYDWENIKFTALVTAPAVVLHEVGHKVVAISFGLNATIHAHYIFLGIGMFLKLLNFPFIFFVPGYVSYPAGFITPLMQASIAFAGPALNLILWLGAGALVPHAKSQRMKAGLILTKQINMFLFIFNMLPFGVFDGAKVFGGLVASF